MQLLAGCPAFAHPCDGGKWPYSCCFVGCCLQDFFNIACSILVQLPSSFFSIHLVVYVVHFFFQAAVVSILYRVKWFR